MMYLDDIINFSNICSEFFDNYDKNKPIAFFGAGNAVFWALKIFEKNGIIPVAICDNNPSKVGQDCFGIKIMSVYDVVDKYNDISFFISSPTYKDEIEKYLSEIVDKSKIFGFACEHYYARDLRHYTKYLLDNKNEFQHAFTLLEDTHSKKILELVIKGWATCDISFFKEAYSEDQYFPNDIIKLSSDEVFVDCGAFTGDTFNIFSKLVNNQYKKYIAFEPDTYCYEYLKKIKEQNDEKFVYIKKGVFEKNETLKFDVSTSEFGSANINNVGTNEIKVVTIDSTIDFEVTYIKMDIEGSELSALKGASELIKKYKPRLAICVYHKNDDIITILKYIKELNKNYKLYLRHHTYGTAETVVYAVL